MAIGRFAQLGGGKERRRLVAARAPRGRCSRSRAARRRSPRASRSASISTAIAAPNGAQRSSSSRDHCTRTGRPVSRAGEERRIERDVVGAVVAVAAGALDVLDDDALRRQAKHEGEVGPQIVDALAVRPDMHAAVAPLRDGAGRGDRGMGEEGPRVARRKVRDREPAAAPRRHDAWSRPAALLSQAVEPCLVGQRLALRPRRARAQLAQRLGGVLPSRATTPRKSAVAHHRDDPGTPPTARPRRAR